MSEKDNSSVQHAKIHLRMDFKNSSYCVLEHKTKYVALYIPNHIMQTAKGDLLPINENLEVSLYKTEPLAEACPIHGSYYRKSL